MIGSFTQIPHFKPSDMDINEEEHNRIGDEFKRRLTEIMMLPEETDEAKKAKLDLLLELKSDVDNYLMSVGLLKDENFNFISPD